MRYLKLFEDHNSYYYQIGEDEFNEITQYDNDDGEDKWDTSNWIDFNKSEIDTIKGMFDDYFVFIGYNGTSDTHRVFNQNHKSNGMIVVSSNPHLDMRRDWSGTLFYAIKLPDEWFFVADTKSSCFYKCDQLDGLINCLKSIF